MKAILTDVTRCLDCELCVEKCKEINKLGIDRPWKWLSPDGLSASRWTTVIARPGNRYVRKHCQHCLEPSCVAACPVGALRRTAAGAIIYDVSVCLGCRYCMNACPFGIPRYNWESPRPAVQKCHLCYPRLLEGKKPGCVEVCPTEATIFGERAELMAEAQKRIKAAPNRYLPKIWGEHWVGGTSVLYISDTDLEFLGWKKDLGDYPLPQLTWRILKHMPLFLLTIGGMMAGLFWLGERKNKVQKENEQNFKAKDKLKNEHQ